METNHTESKRASLNEARNIGVALAVVLAGLVTLAGCGQHASDGATQTQAESQTPSGGSNAAVAAAMPSTSVAPVTSQADQGSRAPEAAAPDIEVATLDTLVAPGAAIEIAMHGTPDVSEMALYDGLNDAQPLVYDAASNLWKVNYRVPLKPKSERLALSVTARNTATHWRRVWIFLHVENAGGEVKADTTATPPSGN